jgi:uncharacterized membrane protein
MTTTTQVRMMAPPSNALALASLVLGIIANAIPMLIGFFGTNPPNTFGLIFFVWGPTVLPGLLAVIFGFVGVTTANRLGGKRKSFAVWGIVLGFTPMLTYVVARWVGFAVFGA